MVTSKPPPLLALTALASYDGQVMSLVVPPDARWDWVAPMHAIQALCDVSASVPELAAGRACAAQPERRSDAQTATLATAGIRIERIVEPVGMPGNGAETAGAYLL